MPQESIHAKSISAVKIYSILQIFFFQYVTETSRQKEIAILARKELACGLVLGECRFCMKIIVIMGICKQRFLHFNGLIAWSTAGSCSMQILT